MRILTIRTFLFIILITLPVCLIFGQKSQLNSLKLPKLRVDVWQMDQGLPVLLLCKEFIEKHGGKIWVESKVGHGSIFYFTLATHNT